MDSAECLSEEVFARYLKSLDHLVEADDQVPQRVAEEVQKLVVQGHWLPEDCCEPGDECYRRHVLYGDPAGRFTVLAVVWRPGQGTPLHGHTAWGAVGVYRGYPSVATYRYVDGEMPVPTGEYHCKPGDVCHVTPGTAEPHRVFNASDDIASHSDEDTIYSDDGYIDIIELIEDELILAIPLVAKHENRACNEDWQRAEKESGTPAKENPFAVLQQLKTTD